MKPPSVTLQEILMLAPVCMSLTVPEEYRDENGHMNMRWYLAIFDDAGDVLHDRVGLTREFHGKHGTGTFDLEHHLFFLSEVNPGDKLSIYMRFVSRSEKRLHYLMFMVNETRGKLASIFECMNAFADLSVRRTAPFPEEIARQIDEIVAQHSKLNWPPPLSAAM